MSKIVSTQQQVERNIVRFRSELDNSSALQRRLPYARAWYATKDETGEWQFGPSKFIGYRNMTADEYVNDEPRDGRQTERKLGTWFVEVSDSEHEELYEELSSALVAFLAEYDKAPSTAMRINVSADFLDTYQADDESLSDRALADLLIMVTRRLNAAERARVRAAI